MTSHETAAELEAMAVYLRNKPEFPTPGTLLMPWLTYYSKDEFLAAVRACKPGEKNLCNDVCGHPVMQFRPTGSGGIIFEIARDQVCTLIAPAREAEYRCEPLLSTDEERELQPAE